MFIPFLLLAGIIGVITMAAKANAAAPAALAAAPAAPPITMRPLPPEATRLLALLVLFARDKKYPAGKKRYLSPNTALEAVKLARLLSLPKTAMAIRKDDAIPEDEYLPGRTVSIRQSVVAYGTTGKA